MTARIMDDFDRKILKVLQTDSGLSNAELAARIGLSPSPCLRRVKALERAGVIAGYAAKVNREAVGLSVSAFVEVQLERQTHGATEAFLAAVDKLPQVVACYLMTGSLDFLLQVVAPDLAAYGDFITHRMLKLPGVKDVRSSFVLKEVKQPGGLPLDHIG
ncbi:MAG: Lrp/AsnC family transcriptional regulator [Rhodospirillaceae bacterium]|nr:Lrp/AsnC family transcriptional regulator [Rhodospirillaceae bacterium]